jgi:hypothetical protein
MIPCAIRIVRQNRWPVTDIPPCKQVIAGSCRSTCYKLGNTNVTGKGGFGSLPEPASADSTAAKPSSRLSDHPAHEKQPTWASYVGVERKWTCGLLGE